MTAGPNRAALRHAIGVPVARDTPQYVRLLVKGVEIVIRLLRSMKR